MAIRFIIWNNLSYIHFTKWFQEIISPEKRDYFIYSFFILGLISAIAFRAIIVIQRLEPAWIRPAWYTGTIGYFLFFLYRYIITQKRKRAIKEFQLIEKVKANACLTEKDREVVLYLLTSVKYSLEDINYAIIFLLSVLSIAADLFLSSL